MENTPGITRPSAGAQEALIRRVHAEAGPRLADRASSKPKAQTLYIGFVKSSVDHLEGGARPFHVVKPPLML
ncbi:hypothetical protein VTI74DRAFT_8606 [Chaetomium olivicolor]